MVSVLVKDIQADLHKKGWESLLIEEGLMIYERGLPYLFIKFKANIDDDLTIKDKEHFIKINSTYQNSFFALIDGVETKVYGFDFGYFGCFSYISSLFDFLAILPNDLWEDDIHRRIHNIQRVQHEKVIQLYEEYGLVSEYTENSVKAQISELLNALFYEKYSESNRKLKIKIIEDQGLRWIKTSNAAGGYYEGLHRQFLVEIDKDVIFPFAISMFATVRTINDEKFGNRNGSTQLNVAICHTKNIAYNLQLNLNDYLEMSSPQYQIWHSGRRSRLKSEYVKKIVSDIAPHLIDDNHIHIAKFLYDKSIDSDHFSIFIENLIMYSYCRYITDQKYR